MKIVKISWVDAESVSEWTPVSEFKDPEPRTTLGYLVKETEATYFVASSHAMHGDELVVGDTIAIPKGWIKEIVEIKDVKKKTPRVTKSSEHSI